MKVLCCGTWYLFWFKGPSKGDYVHTRMTSVQAFGRRKPQLTPNKGLLSAQTLVKVHAS